MEKLRAKLHHTATCRGYVARTGQGYVLPYKGHYGKGYVYHAPSYISTSYYIEEE